MYMFIDSFSRYLEYLNIGRQLANLNN